MVATGARARNASRPGLFCYGMLGGNGVTPIMLHPLSSRLARPIPLHTTAFLLVSLFTTVEAQQVVYVDTTAAGVTDGTSWHDAFTDLQDALDVAEMIGETEVRVAGGTYIPSRRRDADDPRSATFSLPDGISLLGAYAGVLGKEPDARDFELFETILTGDLGVLDWPFDNSYHVVTASGTDATAVLDGFTITGGNARASNLPRRERSGGGLYNVGGAPTVTNCTFDGNSAIFGGAFYNERGDPYLTHCRFIRNRAFTVGADGFDGLGGGMYNTMGCPTLARCVFRNNRALAGGGFFTVNSQGATLAACTFHGNEAGLGGAVYNVSGRLAMINCVLSGNVADGPVFFRTTVVEGGALYNRSASLSLTHCTISGNVATGPDLETLQIVGGGLYSEDTDDPAVGPPVITNCIFWGNRDRGGMDTRAQIYTDSGAAAVNYSCIQGGWLGEGVGNIDADPMFVRDPDDGGDGWGVGDNDDFGDLRLQMGSSAIDAGTNDALPIDAMDDLTGRARRRDDPCRRDTGNGTPPIVDMGAFEFVPRPGDADCDGDTDLADLLDFQACFVGPGEIVEPRCLAFDSDGDGDIDLSDLVNFQAGFTGARAGDIRITAVLPNPVGTDARNEQVRFANATDTDLDLTGWKLQDRAGNEFPLVGIVPAHAELTITMDVFSMPLNNTGDEVWLIDADGLTRHHIAYERRDVDEGVFITFR